MNLINEKNILERYKICKKNLSTNESYTIKYNKINNINYNNCDDNNNSVEIDKIFKKLSDKNYVLIIRPSYDISIKINYNLLLFLIDSLIMLYYLKNNNINHNDLKKEDFIFLNNNSYGNNRDCFKLINLPISINNQK